MATEGRAYGRVVAAALGPLLAAAALAVYLVTMSRGAFPGESAALITTHTGLLPRLLPTHALWAAVASACVHLPFGGLAVRMNLLSALCGALAVWALYELVSRALLAVAGGGRDDARVGFAAVLGGAAAALYLAFCTPFWIVSTRAHTAAFDVLMLLAAGLLFVRYVTGGRMWLLLAGSFLFGLGMVEFATFIAFAPLAATAALLGLWHRDHLRAWPVAGLVGALLAGFSLCFLAAGLFVGSDGYELRGYTGYLQVVRELLFYQYLLLVHSLPREGWLLVLLTTTVPWLTSLAVARRGLGDERDWSYYILHTIVTALSVAVLVNVKFAPWPMLGFSRLLVTPYLLSAGVFGYVAAYWFLLPLERWRRDETRSPVRLAAGAAAAALCLAATLVMPFLNAREADGRRGAFVDAYAGAVLDSMGGRTWLVSDGLVDHHVLIAARDRGRRVNLLSLPMSRNDVYMKMVARQFDDVRLQNLAGVGMAAMVQEWMRRDDGIAGKLAVQSVADLWVAGGLIPVAEGLVFCGARDRAAVDGAAAVRLHTELWQRVVAPLQQTEVGPRLQPLREALLRQASLAANNLGVLLEDLGMPREAVDAYRRAREAYPHNLSAMLNLASLGARDAGLGVDPAAVRREIQSLLHDTRARVQIWALSRYCGYVRLPQAFVDLGWTWALSGEPGLAVAGMKRAMELLPEGQRGRLRQTLAGLYFQQQEDDRSEAMYNEVLTAEPGNARALLGLARIAIRAGDLPKAQERLRAAERAGASRAETAVEWAALYAVSGDLARARVVLEELVALEPAATAAWGMLVGVIAAQRDVEGLEKCIDDLRRAPGDKAFALVLAEAHLAMLRGDLDLARNTLERALELRPHHAHVLELLLRLDVLQARSRDAELHARRLLAVDPEHSFANYIMGGLHLKAGNPLLAEDSYRLSLARERRTETLNDLAWVLQVNGQLEEAEKLAREALQLDPSSGSAWDTLGVILMRTGRLDEAAKALEKALTASQGHAPVYLHVAELRAEQGDQAGLREALVALAEKRASLSVDEQRRLAELEGRLAP